MKKIKIVAIVSGALTLLQLLPVIFYAVIQIGYGIKVASSVGIIGSADGPTAVYVINGASIIMLILARYGFLLLCAVTFIISTVMCLKRKNK